MDETRVYDWNGVLITVDGFWRYLQEHHSDVYDAYKVRGDRDPEVKRAVRPRLLEIYEAATLEGLYPVELIPHVHERLASDREQGLLRTIFTSAPRVTIERQLGELGVSVDQVVVLADIQREFGLSAAIKEDPAVFEALARYLPKRGMGTPVSYVDDAVNRIKAAVQANSRLRDTGNQELGRLYLFDSKAATSPIASQEYTTINNLLHIER